MLHRSIKFVHAAVLAFSALLSFLFLRDLDERWVTGSTAVVWVTDSTGAASGADITRLMAGFAAQHRVTVARETPDLKEPYSRRHLYLAPGGPHSDWLEHGYPAFTRDQHTEVHPVAELGNRDPRGYYYVFGPDRAVGELVRTFTARGLQTSAYDSYSLDQLGPAYSDSALLRSFFVVLLAVVTMTGAGVMLNAKAYAVQRLQGSSFGRIVLRDLRQLAVFWAAAFAAVTALTLVLLGLYNGLAWLGLFTLLALGIAALLTLASLAVHAVTLQLTSQIELLRALKGELPARTAALSTYLVRIPALLLAVSIAGDVVIAGQNIASREDSIRTYREIGDTTAIALNGSAASESAFVELDAKVGGWLRRADRDGQVVVAGHRRFRHSGGLAGLPDRDLLIVNESYLAAQPVLDAAGRRIPATTSDPTRVRLVVPAGLARHTDTLAAQVPGLLSPGDPSRVPAGRITPVSGRDGQRLFTYNPRGRLQTMTNPDADESFVTGPVVVVFPDGSPYLSNRGYVAYASQQSLVFKDPDDVTAGIAARHLETYVTGMSPVGQNAALKLRELTAEFRLQLFNLGVALVVLLVTGVGVCIVHSRKNAQAVFARYISGWGFAATHRPLLAVEGALAVLLALWVPFRVWQQNQDLAAYRASGLKPPAEPLHITGLDLTANAVLVAVEVAAVLVALAVFHRRIVREGAAES